MGGTDYKDLNGKRDAEGSLFGLRELRESRGISFREIVKATKVSPAMIQVLEGDEIGKLPEPVYTKAFLKAYARALQVDEDDLLDRHRTLCPAEAAPANRYEGLKKRQPRPSRLPKVVAAIILVLLAATAVYVLWDHRESWYPAGWQGTVDQPVPETQATPAVGDGGQGGALPAPSTEVVLPSREPTGEEPLSEEPAILSAVEGPPEISEKVDGSGEASSAPGEIIREDSGNSASPIATGAILSEPDEAGDLVLEIRASDLTWVQVVRDEERPEQFNLRPGSSITRRAASGFEVVLGNAGGAEVFFQGTSLGSLGRKGQVVTLTLPESSGGQ